MDLRIGDLVNLPMMESVNLYGNFMLADLSKLPKPKKEVICEVAAFSVSLNKFLLFVPKGTGWSFSKPEFNAGQLALDALDKAKTLQHNGWWVEPRAISSKVDGSW